MADWNRSRGRWDEERDDDRAERSSGSRYSRDAADYGRSDWGSTDYERDRDYGSQFDREYGGGYSRSSRATSDYEPRDGYDSQRYGSDAGEYSGRGPTSGFDRDEYGSIDDRWATYRNYGAASTYDRDLVDSSSRRNMMDRGSSETSRYRSRPEPEFDNRGNVGVPGYGTAYGGWGGNYDSTGVRGTSRSRFGESTGRDMGRYESVDRSSKFYQTGEEMNRESGMTPLRAGGMSSGRMSSGTSYGSELSGRATRDLPTERTSHRGKGPKGFQRSDERIREMVCERLEDHDAIDASDVEVSVKNGEVTLTGNVHDRHMKRLAEDVIEHLPGVRDVNNDLRVNRGLMSRVSEGMQRVFGGSNPRTDVPVATGSITGATATPGVGTTETTSPTTRKD